MTKLHILSSIAVMAAGLMVQPVAAADGVIRIGATLKMVSQQGQRSGQMLTDEFDAINKAGGINGHKIELMMLNDECKSDRGVSNAIKLINEYKAHVLVGSHCSSVTMPIVDISARAKIPQISPASSADGITKRGSAWVFRDTPSERFYRSVVGEYIGENIGKKVAYLVTADAAAQSFAKNIMEYMRNTYKVEPVFLAQATEQDVDYRSIMLKIKGTNPNVITFAGNGPELAKMILQAGEVGIPTSVPRVTNAWACASDFPELAGDKAVGVIHVCPTSAFEERPAVKEFVKMTTERYGIPRPDSDFMLTYDLVGILKIALSNAKLTLTDDSLAADREAIRDALASIKDYWGVAGGPINFCADPTPQCRDGNRTPMLLEYVKGGKDYSVKVLKTITYKPDHEL
jgi:branched-chain amino acid transport system substrate-binding protein